MPKRSLHFARDDVTEVAFSKHIRCTLREINPFPHTVISNAVEKSSLHSALSCSFRKRFPLFPLSHIQRYTGVQERSLHFGRDDDTGIAFSKHIRCTLREINPFPHTVISNAVEKSSLHSALSCSFRKRFPLFPLSHIQRYTGVQERSLHFGRDDDTGIAFSKHIRCTLREINPFPHTVISSAARNLSCTPSFLAPFAKGFPFSAVSYGTLYRYAKRIPPLRSG